MIRPWHILVLLFCLVVFMLIILKKPIEKINLNHEYKLELTNEIIRSSRRSLNHGFLDNYQDRFQQVWSLDSNVIRYHRHGVYYFRNGFFAEGLQALEQCIKIRPEECLGYLAYAKLSYLEDYRGALDDFEAYNKFFNAPTYPTGKNSFYFIGQCHIYLQQYEKAIEAFDKCIEIDGKNGLEWVELYLFVYRAYALKKLNRLDEAEKDLRLAINHSNNCVEAYYQLSDIKSLKNQPSQACELLRKAKQLSEEGNLFNFKNLSQNISIKMKDIDNRLSEICLPE